MSRVLINKSPLVGYSPYVKFYLGPSRISPANQKPEKALLDTGFNGQIILPLWMKNRVLPHLLKYPLHPDHILCPMFRGFREAESRPAINSFPMLDITIVTEDRGQKTGTVELNPEVVSFEDTGCSLFGGRFFNSFGMFLSIDYKNMNFTLEQL